MVFSLAGKSIEFNIAQSIFLNSKSRLQQVHTIPMKKFFCSFALAAMAFSVFAQTGTIRGTVFDKNSGEPIGFANVLLEGTSTGTNTDINGFYTIAGIEPGSYTLRVTYLGYTSDSAKLDVRKNAVLTQNLYIQEGIQLGVVDVTGKKIERKTEVQISKLVVTPKLIKRLPGTGEPDLAQYLQILPGVIFTGDQGGQLYIRGGSPIQNKILLDGLTIYNPFHSIGFFSVFETEAIRSVDVYTGGFDATYGGRVSAIVDINMREGNKKRFAGLVSANPFQAKALIEGPIVKMNESGSSASFLLTGKHSYINETSKSLYSYVNDSTGLPFSFTDFYGKVSINGGTGSQFSVFGFNFNDRVNYPNIADVSWDSYGIGTKFRLLPANTKMIIGGGISYSSYDSEFIEAEEDPRTSGINGFNANMDFGFIGNDSEVRYGFEINGYNTSFNFLNSFGVNVEQEEFTTELALFFKYRQVIRSLVLEPSIRFHYYASFGDLSIEPRLGLKYNINDDLRFKMAGGLYSQNLISTRNERDVVNLFVGFLSGPDETIYKQNTLEPTDHKLQKSIHLVTGFEYDITDNFEVNLEPYYKGFTQLIGLNRNKQRVQDPNYSTEVGEAYGIDLLLKYENKRAFIWTAYSYGFVNRNDGEQEFPTHFDRRHNLNFLASYAFGKNKEWEAGIRWNLGSGFPFTLTQGFYEDFDFSDGLQTDVLRDNGDLGIIYDENRNAGRLPYYHRLDASVKRTWKFGKHSKLVATLSATNIYDRENIFYFDRVRYERVNQLPILPSAGLTFSF